MERGNHASYAKIGIVVIAGVAAVLAALIWIGGFGGDSGIILAETYYDKPVSGLSVGSAVNFRGVNVGSVRDITFIGTEYPDAPDEDGDSILVIIAFEIKKLGLVHETPESELRRLIAKGMRATVSASGVTGLSRIELDFAKKPSSAKAPTWHPRRPCIPPEPSLFDNVADAATRIMAEIDRLDLTAGWTNVVRLVKSAADVTDKMNAVDLGPLARSLSNVEEATVELKETIREIRANPSRLLHDVPPQALPETAR